MNDLISIRGARTHNLQNINVDIPRNKLVVITGVSGSGKSSLAFDTLLAEGQRQYVLSLSLYSRQFFDQLRRPDVDRIEGLSPTVAVDQRPGAASPRSTVATITEIHDYLRVLMARAGDVNCPSCGTPIAQQTPAQIEESVRGLPENSRVMLLAPFVLGRKGAHREAFESIQKAGFVRARVDGTIYPLEEVPPLAPQQTHEIEAVVDRLVIRDGVDSRLSESIRLALRHGDGVVIVMHEPPNASSSGGNTTDNHAWQERIFNTRYACPRCDISIGEIEPRTFSFNSPYGACPICQGTGVVALNQETETRRLGDKEKVGSPISQSPDLPVTLSSSACPACHGTRLRPEARAVQFNGKAIFEITALTIAEGNKFFRDMDFPPPPCGEGANNQSPQHSFDRKQEIIRPLLSQITRRLEFLLRVGVDYLTLDRPADTLSAGERQRVRLATGLGAGLVGILYLLDEPSIGLHPRDNERLIAALRALVDQGNSVIVVEHDEAIIRASDHLIEIGPAAGPGGGHIVVQGDSAIVAASAPSLVAPSPSDRLAMERRRSSSNGEPPGASSPPSPRPNLTLTGASTHNLQNLSLSIPLHTFVCVTGVSGSGKSSLVQDVLAPLVAKALRHAGEDTETRRQGKKSQIRRGGETESESHSSVSPCLPVSLSFSPSSAVTRLVQIDSNPIGRTPRANAATYTGIWNDIRRIFAKTKLSRQRGYGASRFSFNAPGGRCEECRGAGVKRIAMNFLPDLEVTCPVCHGRRFNEQTLAVRFRGQSIADVLDLNVDAAAEFFVNHEQVHGVLTTLAEVGLGYLTLGQPATTLSGGEAQRIKLATELALPRAYDDRSDRSLGRGHTLYILDEPTTGLATADIGRLLPILHRLVDQGHSMIVIEHNLDVIKSADWIIDLGPEGGAGGGRIVVAGTPEDVAACEASHTGRFLRDAIRHECSRQGAEESSRKGEKAQSSHE